MSENKILELYQKLPEKRIAMAKAIAKKAEPSVLNRLDREIIAIRKEIFKELKAIEQSYKKEG